MNKKLDLLYLLENSKYAKEQKDKYFNDTVKYQKQYNFDMGTGQHATWNNEADAFKHAYMQAHLCLFKNKNEATVASWLHERNGNKYQGQSNGEENMDLWNNKIGQEIGEEIEQELKGIKNNFTQEQIEDWIAHKVMQRMKAGQLITNPNDKRKYSPKNNSTGFAVPTEDEHIFTQEEIAKMSNEEFEKNEEEIMSQMEQGLIKNIRSQNKDFSNYTNPITGEGKIYTKEDIKEMSDEDFDKLYKEITAQANSTIGIPERKDLEKAEQAGGVIYVKSYTRSDGTEVKGYYRSKPNI